jgi:hypothetical protein
MYIYMCNMLPVGCLLLSAFVLIDMYMYAYTIHVYIAI